MITRFENDSPIDYIFGLPKPIAQLWLVIGKFHTGKNLPCKFCTVYSQIILIKFLQCQAKQLENIPYNGEQCIKEASVNTLKWSDVETCVNSNKANELFHQSIQKTRLASVRKSCTIHLNGHFWCQHDGIWYGCSEGHNEQSLIKAICSRYNGPNKPIECTTISI